jgi:protein-arginine kinase
MEYAYRFLQAANACRYWPTGRGIYHNKEKTFLVWVNEEDHLRIISMQPGGNVGEVLERLNRVKTTYFSGCLRHRFAVERDRFLLSTFQVRRGHQCYLKCHKHLSLMFLGCQVYRKQGTVFT